MKFKENLGTWKEVFGKVRYLLLAVIITLVFYLTNVLIASWETVFSVYSLKGFYASSKMFVDLSLGFGNTIMLPLYVSLILIGLLLGMFFSLVVYRTKISVKGMDKKDIGIFATLGVFLGVLAPSCAAWGVGILSALGFGVIAINFLPFKGLEISLISIAILGFSVVKITDKISNGNSCSIELKGGKKNG